MATHPNAAKSVFLVTTGSGGSLFTCIVCSVKTMTASISFITIMSSISLLFFHVISEKQNLTEHLLKLIVNFNYNNVRYV
jgi:hypothetical protein